MFLLVDLDQDDEGQDKTDVLAEYYFAFWFGWSLKVKHIEPLQIFVVVICIEENLISAPAKELLLPNTRPGVREENLTSITGNYSIIYELFKNWQTLGIWQI